ncbi:MAG: hypothetical protein ACJ79A_01285 [Gemmatimonadaceae bacterium]
MRRSNEWASSVRAAFGARAIWAITLVGLAVVGGCATGQKTGKTGSEPETGAIDLNTGRRVSGNANNSNRTTVVVDNQNLNEMTIYAYQGTQRMRLGRARASSTTQLLIPSSMISGVVQMRFYAEPMVTGGQRAYLSESIPVQPGDQVDFLIPFTR